MHEVDYSIVDPACEVNERSTRDKNDGKEVMDDCDLALDLYLTERIEVNDETLPYVEEDCKMPRANRNRHRRRTRLFLDHGDATEQEGKRQEEIQTVW